MNHLLSLSVLFALLGVLCSMPAPTEQPMEQTTIVWAPKNSDIRKHINLINEFSRIREEQNDEVDATATPDESMISMDALNDGLQASQALIHEFFKIRADLEKKKAEYEAMTTTTTIVPTTAPRGFLKKIFGFFGSKDD